MSHLARPQSSPFNSPLVLAPRGRGDGSQFLDLLATALSEFLARRKLPNSQRDRRHLQGLPDGSLKLKPVSWQATLFYYRKPNHTLYSGIARACNDVWQLITRPKGLQFSESVIRFPAYIAGIASIATIALLLNELQFASAGVVAAFLSAFHPWHIRYASEARAYAFVLCLIPLVIFFFLRALENGRLRWWAAFAIGEFLLMYSYPTCVYVLVVLNVCALPAIWWRWGRSSDAITQIMRLTVSNVFAAMFFPPLMLPCVPQFLAYVKREHPAKASSIRNG